MVYFLQNEQKNIKIGYTQNIRKRKKELETANAYKLKLIGFIPEVKQHFEHHLHGICYKYNIDREWYKKEVIAFIKSIVPINKLCTFL